MSDTVIKILSLVSGGETPFDGQWLVEYDPTRSGTSPDGQPMLAHVKTTDDPAQAKRFADGVEAFEYWRQVGVPAERPDGQPNRPLTAFNVEVGPLEQPQKEDE